MKPANGGNDLDLASTLLTLTLRALYQRGERRDPGRGEPAGAGDGGVLRHGHLLRGGPPPRDHGGHLLHLPPLHRQVRGGSLQRDTEPLHTLWSLPPPGASRHQCCP